MVEKMRGEGGGGGYCAITWMRNCVVLMDVKETKNEPKILKPR